MISTLLLVLSIDCLICFAVSNTATSEPISCNLNRRTESCPEGQCCARDEFLPSYIICKDIGNITSSCSTVPDDSVCPCAEGLVCVPNVDSSVFVSIHGTCQIATTTNPTTSVLTTTLTTKTTFPTTTVKRNHPPMIRLQGGVTKVSMTSGVGKTITTFSVVDNDSGKDGETQCSVLQPQLFKIEKGGNHTFNVVVATSLSRLKPQSVLAFIICEDNGNPKLNGIAQLRIQIVKEEHHSTPSSTMATFTSSSMHPISILTTLASTQAGQTPTIASISTFFSSTKRSLASVTFN